MVGLVLGGLAGFAGLGGEFTNVGPWAVAAFGGGVLAAYGAIAGVIARGDESDRHLRQLQYEVERGKLLVAVETEDPALGSMCERIFSQRGGRQVSF